MDREGIALRIGRLVIACAELDLAVSMIARDLGEEHAERLSTGKRLKAIHNRTRGREDAQCFADWVGRTDDVLRQRGRLAHGMFVHIPIEGGVEEAFTTPREPNVLSVELGRLDALVAAASELNDEASVLGNKIVREMIEAVYPTWFDHPRAFPPQA